MNAEPPNLGDTMRGHCPECGPHRFAEVVGIHRTEEADREHQAIWEIKDYIILKCAGCKHVYFQTTLLLVQDIEAPLSENPCEPRTTYWPSPSKRARPKWLREVQFFDPVLYRLLSDIYKALDDDLLMYAAMGLRTAFDYVSGLLDADPAITFKEKLDWLQQSGSIGQQEREHLDTLTDAGGAAAHRGWQPTLGDIDTLMSIGEQFIYRAVMLQYEADHLKEVIPSKPVRRPKTE
jgi:hypothetical protein